MDDKKKTNTQEPDSLYFLKLLLYFIIGGLWLRVAGIGLPLPVGFVLGLLFASHEHFQIDRKIEYAMLLIAAILSLVAPIGIVLDATGL